MGVVLLVGHDEDTLKSLGLLAELEEDNLGTLGAHVVQTGAEHDLLSDISLSELVELEPFAACEVSNVILRIRTKTLSRLVKRELAVVLGSIVLSSSGLALLALLLLTSGTLGSLLSLLGSLRLLLELALAGTGLGVGGRGGSLGSGSGSGGRGRGGGGGVLGGVGHFDYR